MKIHKFGLVDLSEEGVVEFSEFHFDTQGDPSSKLQPLKLLKMFYNEAVRRIKKPSDFGFGIVITADNFSDALEIYGQVLKSRVTKPACAKFHAYPFNTQPD